jgi:hypothetical protein
MAGGVKWPAALMNRVAGGGGGAGTTNQGTLEQFLILYMFYTPNQYNADGREVLAVILAVELVVMVLCSRRYSHLLARV